MGTSVDSLSEIPDVNGSVASVLVAVLTPGLSEVVMAVNALVDVASPREGILSKSNSVRVLGSTVLTHPRRLVVAHEADSVVGDLSGLTVVITGVLVRVLDMINFSYTTGSVESETMVKERSSAVGVASSRARNIRVAIALSS